MYNGIGLATPRGSGTNGYVQRNWATVRKTKEKVQYRTEEELEALDASNNRQPNQEILDHERKRKIEVKCVELEEILEEQGWVSAFLPLNMKSYFFTSIKIKEEFRLFNVLVRFMVGGGGMGVKVIK